MENLIEKLNEYGKRILNCKMVYYIAIMILFISTYYADLKYKLEELDVIGGNHLKYFLIAAILSGIIIVLLLKFSKKLYTKLKPHLVYMILALILGTMYIFIIPLCSQSDEPAHLYRAFQVTQGEVISPVVKGKFVTELPKAVREMIEVNSIDKKAEYKKYYDIENMMQVELDKEETERINTVGNYLGISYFPHVIGMGIGMLFNMNPYYSAMLGRFTGLVVIVLLFTLGIKKLPKHKLFATIILLSPVALSYSACISADSVLLAAAFLMFSYVLHFMHTKEKLTKRNYILFGILTFILAVSKMAYVPIILILAFIPKESFKDSKDKFSIIALFIMLGFTASMWWMGTANISVTTGDPTETNTWMFREPHNYLVVLFRTTVNFIYGYIENAFAGGFLCHAQVQPAAIVPLTYIIIAIIAFLSDENEQKTTNVHKLIAIGIIAFVYVLISSAMYMYNTEYRGGLIIGVQGRYLLPIILMAMFFANKKRIDVKEEELTNISLISNYAVYMVMLATFFV